MKKCLITLAMVFLLIVGGALAEEGISSKDMLNEPGRRIGVSQGSAGEKAVMSEFPEATIEYYTDTLLGYTAVAQGKLDAFVYDRVQMQLTINNGLTGVRLLPEAMEDTVQIAVGISDVSAIGDLEEKVNRFIAELRSDGTLDDMYRRWVIERNDTMPEIPVPEKAEIHLTVGTTGSVPPYSYFEGGGLTGYDIELAYRFAAWLGADVSFRIYDFNGIIPAAKSGKIDVIMSNLQYLPERAETLTYSDILYEEKQGIMVKDDGTGQTGAPAEQGPAYTSLSDFNGRRIGVVTGALQGAAIEKEIPGAELSYFNSVPDLLTAARQGKIDAFSATDQIIRYLMTENDDLTYLDEPLTEIMYTGVIFPKTEAGGALRDEFNQYLTEAGATGVLEELDGIWLGKDENRKTVLDISSLSGENGTLILATDASMIPNSYVKDNTHVGLDIDNVLRFCQARGYALKIVDISFSGLIETVISGKCDFAAGAIAYTEERAESVDFSDPVFRVYSVIAYLKTAGEQTPETKKAPGIWENIRASFDRTFLREDRWKLFLEGIGNTMLITVLSILFGTALGFLVFMICRNGSAAANGAAGFCVWLVRGTPMVVLLMILYYIIFGSVAISGIAVAVIGFTLTFGASVFGLLKMGVGTIDRGQYEAAYALGHTNRHTFFKIILPQAVPHVLPAYQGEIVGLIKATAIVGYIAVQDLTKMGDIVRSRTYEAFFPLIAITIIYFALEGLFSFAVSRVRISVNPRKRSRERILKGIRTSKD